MKPQFNLAGVCLTDRSLIRTLTLRYCAPALLVSVAGIQIYLAFTTSLSPWKGGGFGMFSTVDAPSARFLRVYLVTPQGDIPALVPESLLSDAREVRTIPTRDRLVSLADQMARGTWLFYRLVPAAEHYRSLMGREPITAPAEADGRSRPPPGVSGIAAADGVVPFVRMLEAKEPRPTSNLVDVRGVRAELWRYRFDAHAVQLKAAKILEVAVPRQER